jgi:hypothetical protein
MTRPSDPQTAVPPGRAPAAAADPPRAADQLDYVDLTPAARDAFARWVAYEIWEPAYSKGASEDFASGVIACMWRHEGVLADRVVDLLVSERGYLGGGAAAVLRGALAAMCPSLDLGYRTYFDRNVDRFQISLSNKGLQFSREYLFYEYGGFLKGACHALMSPAVGRSGIRAWVAAGNADGTLTLPGVGATQDVVDIFVREAAAAGCIGAAG